MRRQNILTERGTNPHSDQAINRKLERHEWKFHADSSSGEFRHVDSVLFPCFRITSLKEVVKMSTNAISEKLSLSLKGRAEGSVAILESTKLGCVFFKILTQENLLYVRRRNWDQIAQSNSPKTHGTKSKDGKRKVHREVLSQKYASWA